MPEALPRSTYLGALQAAQALRTRRSVGIIGRWRSGRRRWLGHSGRGCSRPRRRGHWRWGGHGRDPRNSGFRGSRRSGSGRFLGFRLGRLSRSWRRCFGFGPRGHGHRLLGHRGSRGWRYSASGWLRRCLGVFLVAIAGQQVDGQEHRQCAANDLHHRRHAARSGRFDRQRIARATFSLGAERLRRRTRCRFIALGQTVLTRTLGTFASGFALAARASGAGALGHDEAPLVFQSFGATDDFHQLGGDRCLTCAVVL